MATIGKARARCVGRLGGGEVPTLWLKEAASQSFQDGQFVMMNGTAQATVWASDDAGIVGMAQKDASGTTDAEVPVVLNMEDVVWEMNLLGSAAANYTLAAGDIGLCYGMQAASNKCYVDQSDTTNKRCRIIRVAPGSAIGDVNARVHVVLLGSTRNTGASGKDGLFSTN